MSSDLSLSKQGLIGPKPLPPALRKRLQQCFERGKELSSKDKPDHDYAHSMFTECVVNDPSNLEYVEAMLDNLQRKYGNNKKGSRLRGFGGKSNFKKSIADKDWEQIFRSGLEILKKDPWEVATLRAMATACKANRYNEVELRYLKNALDKNPKDIEVNKHCAESLTRMGQFDQAIACWHRIETLDKKNTEAKQKISELTVAKATGIPPGKESSVDDMKSAGSGTSLPKQPNEEPNKTETSEVERLEKLIRDGDAAIEDYKILAEIYEGDNKYREALQIIRRGLDAAGNGNLPMRELYERIQISQVRHQVAVAENRASTERTTEALDLAKRFRAELNRQELAVFAARAERYPEDAKIQFELAKRLKIEGNFREAAKAFEKARRDRTMRATTTLELGECCQQLKQYGNAMKCYQAALADDSIDEMGKKRALYRAGVLAGALKNHQNAEKYLMELLKVDQNYKDASDRLDKIRQIRDKE